ncbi:MAG: hypothetical protein CMJ83_05010 [Planctomycetes bacterium]|nr:hypothetical protein [Planctomycetota bacterium]
MHYVHDLNQREVDLLVVKDSAPWFLVEVELSERPLGRPLRYFQDQLGAPHAFQVAVEAEYVDGDCFQSAGPIGVPARTLLSQLV